jgi:arylsulfatase A-like enzyme
VAHIGGIQGPFALRSGTWKLVEAGRNAGAKAGKGKAEKAAPSRDRFAASPQLFNLADDLAEQKDLAATQPGKLQEMQDLLAQIRAGK